MEDNNNNAIVVQRDATTCAPLVGEPKSLISKGGKNVLDYNQDPPPEFVSDKNRLDCFAFARNDEKTVTNLFPYFPISLSLNKKLRRFRIKSGMTFIKQPAFTLAEVLITLGIIGIVAAMTIPNLITKHQQKVTVTKLEKAISYINQAYKLSYDDVGELTIDEAFKMDSDTYFKTYWAPYLKILTRCTSYSSPCGYKSNNPYKGIGKDMDFYPVHPKGTAFITFDGYFFSIRTAYNTDEHGSGIILVDLNASDGPNRYGKDVFFLTRVAEDGGGVRCYGYEKTNDEINNECSKDSYGMYCAEKIRRAGWKIEKDYPW